VHILKDFNQMGMLHCEAGSYHLAVDLHVKALEYATTTSSCTHEVECYQLLGNAYMEWGQNEAAVEFLKRECELLDKLQDFPSALKGRRVLGEAYRRCMYTCRTVVLK
jgi:hypothetical protein